MELKRQLEASQADVKKLESDAQVSKYMLSALHQRAEVATPVLPTFTSMEQ